MDTARIMGISPTTVIEKIKRLASKVKLPSVFLKGKKYEADELKTYIGKKANECWVCCSLEKETGQIMSLGVGRRNKITLQKALTPILLSEPKRIYTD